VIRSTRDSN